MSTILGDFIRAILDYLGGGPKSYAELSAELDAKANPQHLNWRGSTVDLCKLVGWPSNISDRAKLAKEFGYEGVFTGTEAQGEWLHARLIEKLERQ